MFLVSKPGNQQPETGELSRKVREDPRYWLLSSTVLEATRLIQEIRMKLLAYFAVIALVGVAIIPAPARVHLTIFSKFTAHEVIR